MKNKRICKFLLIKIQLLLILALSSCVIGYYKPTGLDKIKSKTPDKISCDFTFNVSIDFKGYIKENSKIKYENETKKNIDTALKQMGCIAKYDTKKNSDILIYIEEQPFLGASGQDYLSAFSFGIIPTWGKSLELKVILKNKNTGNKKTYEIYYKTYNHITLLPFFWVSLLTPDIQNNFKKILNDFLF